MTIRSISPTVDQFSFMYAKAKAKIAPAKVEVASTAPFQTSVSWLSFVCMSSHNGCIKLPT